ncbi:uncharacterized protein LOC132796250 isoform X2 [Drosophila nasuta]|uniref:uncharacterized protein LOC132796250 isoform X2 n=1 Tax=Drosophila nasuta TaxID=42062 RepID=UPI00295EFB81|nr:uncharacterized protein LOC132796250 isoform X2 [Drosophila nasuta]
MLGGGQRRGQHLALTSSLTSSVGYQNARNFLLSMERRAKAALRLCQCTGYMNEEAGEDVEEDEAGEEQDDKKSVVVGNKKHAGSKQSRVAAG